MRTTTGYSQWYVNATTEIARVAWSRMMRDPNLQTGVRLYLYYKPQGLELRAFSELEDASGYTLATGEAFSTAKTVEQLTYWVRQIAGRLPLFPGE